MKRLFIAVLLLVFSCCASAHKSAVKVQTWHHITVSNKATWQGRLVITSSHEAGYFTNAFGANQGETYDFTLSKKTSPFRYGFGCQKGTDFNISYTLTLYQGKRPVKNKLFLFISKACQFNVTAKSPAKPIITINKYNSALCQYNIGSRGESFTIG